MVVLDEVCEFDDGVSVVGGQMLCELLMYFLEFLLLNWLLFGNVISEGAGQWEQYFTGLVYAGFDHYCEN